MPDRTRPPAILALADGTVAAGLLVGAPGEISGELCFNTSMAGYQEIMTDSSYVGQIMMMTYPHIGNYGANAGDHESENPTVAGLVTRSFVDKYSNFEAEESLESWMMRYGMTGITGIDTRRLVRHIRDKGVMNAVISSIDADEESLVRKAQAVPDMAGLRLSDRVSTPEAYTLHQSEGGLRIAVVDHGIKRNILRSFVERGCSVRVFPTDVTFDEINEWRPDGLFFSNGPGDPRSMPEAVEVVREAIESSIPMFGICLGHQLMSLASGLEVYKMKVGHRGANQPVRYEETRRVEITTQNHGFAVRGESITPDAATITHVNLNDGTVEGLRFHRFNGMSVQYHPEANPGPHDSRYLFDLFLDRVREHLSTLEA